MRNYLPDEYPRVLQIYFFSNMSVTIISVNLETDFFAKEDTFNFNLYLRITLGTYNALAGITKYRIG